MDYNLLFTSALGLKAPWQVSDIRFEPEQGAIHFDLVCDSKRLACPVCDQTDQPIHDRSPRTWQHLHFFQYQAFLHTSLPRVKCGHCGKVTQVEVPWARPGSGFTLLMDALVLTLAKKLPVSAIAQLFGVSENRIWRAIHVHVEAARTEASYADVKALGADEKAEQCLDAFHVSQLVHDALDQVRRNEVKQDASLKGSRWALLKPAKDWSFQQITDMHWLQRSGLKTARAWRMKERYREIHR